MAKFFTSRVRELKKETRQIKNFMNGKTVNQFPIIMLSIVLFTFLFLSLYIYFNVIRPKSS